LGPTWRRLSVVGLRASVGGRDCSTDRWRRVTMLFCRPLCGWSGRRAFHDLEFGR